MILDEISLFYAQIWLLFLTEGYVVHDSFMDRQKLKKNPTIISSFTVSGYNEGNLGDLKKKEENMPFKSTSRL